MRNMIPEVFTRRYMPVWLFVLVLIHVVPMAAAQPTPDYVPQVVVVQFEVAPFMQNKANTTGLRDFDRMAAPYSVHTIERVYPFLDHVEPTPETRHNLLALRRTYYVRYHADADPRPVAKTLSSVSGVVYAEPVLVNRTFASGPWTLADPNDPMFNQQTELRHLRLPEAWDVVKGMDGAVVIAIVDGGGEWRHEDLLANAWTNAGEIEGNGLDDDDNGFIDDVYGVNFANENPNNNDPTGLPETPSNANHGTAVAGAASAVSDNGTGVSGAAWNAEIMHINVGCREFDLDLCFGYEGLMYAAVNGADIINASWGGLGGTGESTRLLDQSLDFVTDTGALVVAAAGNDNLSNDVYSTYPARHPRVLSVGATEKDSRRKAWFSNYGKLVNVFAPGMDIATTASNNEYASQDGTSFSSPLVAGVAALVKTQFSDISPDALREQVRLASESMDASNPGLAGQLGRGYVNALAAVQPPTVPGVRLKRWSWVDDDGDGEIASGDIVTVTATVVNYLIDAMQLRVELVPVDPYTFIDMPGGGVDVGALASGDSTEVQFAFTVSSNAPVNQWVRFYVRMQDGSFVDEVDQLSFDINKSIAEVHRSLSALYTATGGDEWTDNRGWDITEIPSEEELAMWFGVIVSEGWVVELLMLENNLTGMLPAELGGLPNLHRLFLQGNALSGPIPVELGDMVQLQSLYLQNNALSGSIPAELGDMAQLQELVLAGNALSGSVPAELGNLTQLQFLWLQDNVLTGELPRSLMQLTNLQAFLFGGQGLCAPSDDEFQTWLTNITVTHGPTCGALQFTEGVLDQTLAVGKAMVPLVLPEASGGTPPYTYTLVPTALPDGLVFDETTRTISGVPTGVTDATQYTWSVTDQDGSGVPVTVTFTIEVISQVAVESGTLPTYVTVHGNYPNPFRHSTRLVIDLPWSARVKVDVLDITGRRVIEMAPVELSAGWGQEIALTDVTIPSGLYLYRLHVESPKGRIMHVGRFVRIR